MKATRRLSGWPPRSSRARKAERAELRERAREMEREDAARVIDGLLGVDKALPPRRKLARLTTRQRWALHVAAGWLRSERARGNARRTACG